MSIILIHPNYRVYLSVASGLDILDWTPLIFFAVSWAAAYFFVLERRRRCRSHLYDMMIIIALVLFVYYSIPFAHVGTSIFGFVRSEYFHLASARDIAVSGSVAETNLQYPWPGAYIGLAAFAVVVFGKSVDFLTVSFLYGMYLLAGVGVAVYLIGLRLRFNALYVCLFYLLSAFYFVGGRDGFSPMEYSFPLVLLLIGFMLPGAKSRRWSLSVVFLVVSTAIVMSNAIASILLASFLFALYLSEAMSRHSTRDVLQQVVILGVSGLTWAIYYANFTPSLEGIGNPRMDFLQYLLGSEIGVSSPIFSVPASPLLTFLRVYRVAISLFVGVTAVAGIYFSSRRRWKHLTLQTRTLLIYALLSTAILVTIFWQLYENFWERPIHSSYFVLILLSTLCLVSLGEVILKRLRGVSAQRVLGAIGSRTSLSLFLCTLALLSFLAVQLPKDYPVHESNLRTSGFLIHVPSSTQQIPTLGIYPQVGKLVYYENPRLLYYTDQVWEESSEYDAEYFMRRLSANPDFYRADVIVRTDIEVAAWFSNFGLQPDRMWLQIDKNLAGDAGVARTYDSSTGQIWIKIR